MSIEIIRLHLLIPFLLLLRSSRLVAFSLILPYFAFSHLCMKVLFNGMKETSFEIIGSLCVSLFNFKLVLSDFSLFNGFLGCRKVGIGDRQPAP